MKKAKYFLIFSIFLLLLSCKKDNTDKTNLYGTWEWQQVIYGCVNHGLRFNRDGTLEYIKKNNCDKGEWYNDPVDKFTFKLIQNKLEIWFPKYTFDPDIFEEYEVVKVTKNKLFLQKIYESGEKDKVRDLRRVS